MDTRVELNDLSVNGTKLRVEVVAAAAVSEPYEGSKKNGTHKKGRKRREKYIFINFMAYREFENVDH